MFSRLTKLFLQNQILQPSFLFWFVFIICFAFCFSSAFETFWIFSPGRWKETNPDSKEGSTEDPIPDAHLHFFLSLLLSLCFPVVVFLNVCVSLFVVYVRLFFVFLSSGGFSIFWGINTSLGIRFYKISLRTKQIKTRRDNQAMYVSALFFYVFWQRRETRQGNEVLIAVLSCWFLMCCSGSLLLCRGEDCAEPRSHCNPKGPKSILGTTNKVQEGPVPPVPADVEIELSKASSVAETLVNRKAGRFSI